MKQVVRLDYLNFYFLSKIHVQPPFRIKNLKFILLLDTQEVRYRMFVPLEGADQNTMISDLRGKGQHTRNKQEENISSGGTEKSNLHKV